MTVRYWCIKLAPVVAAVLLLGAGPARAAFVPVDLSSIINSNLNDPGQYTNGGNYPVAGPLLIDGIYPFVLADIGGGDTGVVGGQAVAPQSYSVSGLNVSNVVAMYAVINGIFGVCGADVGSIGAKTASSSTSVTLTEGKNVRDHLNGGFCNTATDLLTTVSYPGNIRLDVFRFDLTSLTTNGADDVTEFTFTTGPRSANGVPFVAAVLFETRTVGVPEPALVLLLGSGFTLLAVTRRKTKLRRR